MSSLWLKNHRRDVTSQNGEDGVLAAILKEIGATNKWCCEFGAWDGLHLSNTRNLLTHGWFGVLIESDPQRFRELVVNARGLNVLPICTQVRDDLDSTLRCTAIPRDFDLLSIDVDGDDYLIWKGLEVYRPRVVVIEVNSSFSPEVYRTPIWGQSGGVSIASVVELAKQKGYELALHTDNAIFVLREYAATLGVDPENWKELFDKSWVVPESV